MNVMAKAHKMTKHALSLLADNVKYSYGQMFKVALKQAHKEYKAMQNQDTKAAKIADLVFEANTRIKKLENFLPLAKGYIVTTGQHRICVNAEIGTVEHILKVPEYDRFEDASYYASRIKNGHGEPGQVEFWADRIRWEIEEQKKLIETLENL